MTDLTSEKDQDRGKGAVEEDKPNRRETPPCRDNWGIAIRTRC